MKPVIYLTNLARASAVKVGRSTKHVHEVGAGPVLGILRWPPGWATKGFLQGHVVGLMPKEAELTAARSGDLPWEEYRGALLARWTPAVARGIYAPGEDGDGGLRIAERSDQRLAQHHPDGRLWDGQWWIGKGPVPADATLCCACELAEKCHRSIAAEVLARSGWSVVLDGQPVEIKGDP